LAALHPAPEEDDMPVVKVRDIAYGRLRAPDLDRMEEFLLAFGMLRADRTRTALYMRGTDASHHIHVTELGESGFLGLAFHAASEEDLHRLAKLPGATPVEAIDEPGGGQRVSLREPNGYRVEVVHGIAPVSPIPVHRQAVNTAAERLKRAGELFRLKRGPAQVKRIGHAVLTTPRIGDTVAWFRETLGLVRSDDLYAGSEDHIIGAFSRCDRGAEYVDHHTLFCIAHERAGLNHLSFEVQDIDDVFVGHEHLKGFGRYEHMWGIGRHLLGSNVYDYWSDPWGTVHEHWSDSDRLNAANGGNLLPASEGLSSQWGERPPEKMLRSVTA
jgi:catechol 2,3-dioxygenase-like lactoylglutathione lyase family enzyme